MLRRAGKWSTSMLRLLRKWMKAKLWENSTATLYLEMVLFCRGGSKTSWWCCLHNEAMLLVVQTLITFSFSRSTYVVQLRLLKKLESPPLCSSPTVHSRGFPPIRFHLEHYRTLHSGRGTLDNEKLST